MAPQKSKRKSNAIKQIDEKPLENREESTDSTKSTSTRIVPGEEIKRKKSGVYTDPVIKKKPCSWLKLDRLNPPTESKSPPQSSKAKDAKVEKDSKEKRRDQGEGKRSSISKSYLQAKEKENVEDDIRREGLLKEDSESENNDLGGLIFMCNAKTKPDCFGYQLMGVPANKKEILTKVKPGLKLFLYDYDLKLLYGVFEAASSGGMKLEPAAFGGGFPAQVRFRVQKDCLPLPESIFKKAVSYDEKTRKFKTELNVKQVRKLVDLFHPTPLLKGKSTVPEGSPHIHTRPQPSEYQQREEVPSWDPLFLTEKEYRNYGLRQGNGLLPITTTAAADESCLDPTPTNPDELDRELTNFLRNPSSSSYSGVNHVQPHEYRIHGLRTAHQTPSSVPPLLTMTMSREIPMRASAETCDPYDERTMELVNRYLNMPGAPHVPVVKPHPRQPNEPYVGGLLSSYPNGMDTQLGMINPSLAAAPYTLYSSGQLGMINPSLAAAPYTLYPSGSGQSSAFAQQRADLVTAPVTQRYSFAGPPHSEQG